MTLSDIVLIVLFVTVGALLGGIISFGSGQYALSKSFALTQDKELLTSLRFDISSVIWGEGIMPFPGPSERP